MQAKKYQIVSHRRKLEVVASERNLRMQTKTYQSLPHRRELEVVASERNLRILAKNLWILAKNLWILATNQSVSHLGTAMPEAEKLQTSV